MQPHDFLADITGMPSDVLVPRLALAAMFALGFSLAGLLFALLSRREPPRPASEAAVPADGDGKARPPCAPVVLEASEGWDGPRVLFVRLKAPVTGEWFDAETGGRLACETAAALDAAVARVSFPHGVRPIPGPLDRGD